jgi:hypothetical protein
MANSISMTPPATELTQRAHSTVLTNPNNQNKTKTENVQP